MNKKNNLEKTIDIANRYGKDGWISTLKNAIDILILDERQDSEALKRQYQQIVKKIEKRLKYCQKQNGLSYCKNCGLCPADLDKL